MVHIFGQHVQLRVPHDRTVARLGNFGGFSSVHDGGDDAGRSMSSEYCVACGKTPTDRCHIRSKGAGGTWDADNIMPLCRACHQTQHRLGWHTFTERNPAVYLELKVRGFSFVKEFGIVRLRKAKNE